MSKSACKASCPAWVSVRIRSLRGNPANKDGLKEAELLDAAFSVSQSAAERALAALRDRCDWESGNQRCLGDLSYDALAQNAGTARSSFAASLAVLQRAGVIQVGEGWNYNERGYRAANSYFIGGGSFVDQLLALRQSGVRLSVPVSITIALLGAYDDLDRCSEITLDQLLNATGLSERVIREFVSAARMAGKLIWLGGDKFRFAHPVWGPKPKSDFRGFPFKSDSGKSHAKSDSGREIGRNVKSTISNVDRSSSNDSFPASGDSSRARERARAAADAAALQTDRRRLSFDEFVAKAVSALDGRSLSDLDDGTAYDLMLDAVAEVMPPRFMVSGRKGGLALFRRCVEAWPTTVLMRQPDMLFRELWWKAEKIRQKGGNFSAWSYLNGFVGDVLDRHSLAKHEADVAEFRARLLGGAPAGPATGSVPGPAGAAFPAMPQAQPAIEDVQRFETHSNPEGRPHAANT